MSLLNEMLRDLTNNKTISKPSFRFPPSRKKGKPEIVLYIIYVTVAILFGTEIFFLIHTNWVEKNSTLKSIPLARNISQQARALSPTFKTMKLSELVPIPLLTSMELKKEESLQEIAEEKLSGELSEELSGELTENELIADSNKAEPITVNKKFDNPSANEWCVTQLDKALLSIENGDDEAGIQRLTLIVSKFPAYVDARETLAALYLSQEKYTEAEMVLEEGLEFQPRAINLIMLKARLFIAKEKSKEALALLEKYKPDFQTNPDYYGLMAAIFEKMGRTIEAGSLYQALVKIEPENGQYWLGLGLALEQKHAMAQAIEAYRHTSGINNVKPEIRIYAENRLRNLQG